MLSLPMWKTQPGVDPVWLKFVCITSNAQKYKIWFRASKIRDRYQNAKIDRFDSYFFSSIGKYRTPLFQAAPYVLKFQQLS